MKKVFRNLIAIKGATAQREAMFKLAVTSSIASKAMTAALQFLALPIAAGALGEHQFALYALMTSAVAWLALTNLGIGPMLVVTMARAIASGEEMRSKQIFSSAFFLTLAVSTFVSISAMACVWLCDLTPVFGNFFENEEQVIRIGLTALIMIFFAQINFTTFESAQAAYQKSYRLNLASFLGSVVTLITLLQVAERYPTTLAMIFAVTVPYMFLRAIGVLWIIRDCANTYPKLAAANKEDRKALLRSGSIYSLAGGAGNFFAHVFPIILIAKNFDATSAAVIVVTMNMIVLLSGVLSMFCSPLWAGISDSVARGEPGWAQTAYKKLLGASMVYGILILTTLHLFGEQIFAVWFNGKVTPSHAVLSAAGVYFVALCWESVHFNILMGLQKITAASMLMLMRTVVGALCLMVFIDEGPASMTFVIMAAAVIVFTGWPLYFLVRRTLNSLQI
jgi:O-antigen/teichoic acid export membrane protein